MNDAIRMQISAFVDGELPDAEADLLLRRMSQDAELRQKVAEYLEIGRAIRGEAGVAGIGRLQARISAELDDRPFDEAGTVTEPESVRSLRPLIGIAVAASVALVALFGLQLTPGIDGTSDVGNNVAEVAEDTAYVVPRPIDEQLRQYYLSHGASSSELGANGITARLVTLRLSEEELADEDDETAAADRDDENATQP